MLEIGFYEWFYLNTCYWIQYEKPEKLYESKKILGARAKNFLWTKLVGIRDCSLEREKLVKIALLKIDFSFVLLALCQLLLFGHNDFCLKWSKLEILITRYIKGRSFFEPVNFMIMSHEIIWCVGSLFQRKISVFKQLCIFLYFIHINKSPLHIRYIYFERSAILKIYVYSKLIWIILD